MNFKISTFFLILSVAIITNCQPNKAPVLTIATAANMQFAMKELVKSFEKNRNIKCEVILGSSGKLTTQILEGAPYDIFISADTLFPKKLFNKGRTLGSPILYAHGQLILWTLKKEIVPSFNILESIEIRNIAIANPKTAPYGAASKSILEKLELFEIIEDKVVYGESIAQVNQFISTQAAEIGITSNSIIYSNQLKNKGRWIDIDHDLYHPIPQALVIIKNDRQQDADSNEFVKFLLSEEGKSI